VSQLMKLREDHAQLVKIFRRLGEIVGHESPPPQIELFDIRRELISTLLAHLKLEDWALYPILIESPDPELSHAGKWFKEEMGGLAPSFIAYCDRWTAGTIELDWENYCRDTRDMLAALNNRLTRENRELLPLLERIDIAA
jgi:hypothetical protein